MQKNTSERRPSAPAAAPLMLELPDDRPPATAPGLFGLRVRGDSMTPRFPDGTLVEFRPAVDVTAGQNVYVELENGTATFKAVVAADAETITLRGTAADAPTFTVDRHDVARLAVAEWTATKA